MVLLAVSACLASLVAVSLGLYTAGDDVLDLTASNFQSKVVDSDAIWIVEFYAPWCGHCQSLAPEYKKAAKALKGIVKVGAVDMDAHQSVGAPYGIRGFPTLKIFSSNKAKPADYNGQRNAQGIVNAGLEEVRKLVNGRLGGKSGGGGGAGGGKKEMPSGNAADVVELTDSNFEDRVLNSEDIWLVEFFAPWCGHCKNLEPHWKSAATALKGKVKLGAVDATVHTVIAGRYGVRGYPTIKYFPGGKKDSSSAEDYDGGRTSDAIVAWANEKAAANLPPPELVQITDSDVLKKACQDQASICVIAVLPHILDCQAKCRNKYLKTLRELADKYKKNLWGWLWVEATAQLALEETLGIGGFGYPAMAAVNAKKSKYSILKGSFGYDGINEFLRELSYGKGSTLPLKGTELPKIETASKWDGKDGEYPKEEEIDLSDVDLGKEEL